MSDKMREEFEAWVKSRWPKTIFDRCTKDKGFIICHGQYAQLTVERMWQAFQASRAALVVELPEPREEDGKKFEELSYVQEYNDGIDACREALTKAGVTVK